MMRSILRLLLPVILLTGVMLGGCVSNGAAQDSWAVYIYMCGSDLESESGCATYNLAELQKVSIPENVTFVIQTGGAEKWHMKGIPAKELGRFVYDSTGFHEVARLEDASMGEERTLEDFLRFAGDGFPADHRMLVFWDHGGGSLGGFCLDEKYDDTLSLADLRQALETTEVANPEKPPFDLVLFDTCLMANIETASTLHGFARYLAASEEVMPATGTDYASWAGALARNPSMDGRELGTVICETYLPYCERNDAEEMATLSLIDLGQMPALNAAYENMGREALELARANPRHFFTTYDRVAGSVENYGTNDGDGYTDMVDLGSLAAGLPELRTASAFAQTLEKAVVYKTAGPYRRYGMGLSGYYSLDGGLPAWQTYAALPGGSAAFSRLYGDMLSGSGDGTPWFYFDATKIEQAPVSLDENNMASVTLAPEDANAISHADFLLCRYDKKGNLVYLGSDDKMEVDWERGVFREDFDGAWPALNGHFLSLYLDEQQEDYNLYYSFILLNGKKCYLTAAYDFSRNEFDLLSVRRVLTNGWLDRQILQLKPGDKITPIFLDEREREVKGETFTLSGAPILRDEPLPDAAYAFAFRFTTARNETAASETIHFIIENGEMTAVK